MKLSLWISLCVLALGCSQGQVTPQDEPWDAEEETGDPDGADEVALDDGDQQGDVPKDGTAHDADAQPDDDAGPGVDDAGPGVDDAGPGVDDAGPGVDDAGPVDDGPGPGTEMLLFEGDGRQFTYADSGFHVLINPGDQLPADNWLEPVDYYNGEFHVRYVINSPADQQAGRLQTCIWTMGDDGVGGNYFPESCGQQVSHSGPGEYFVTANLTPADWWKYQGVPLDYSHPERFLVRVVLRGTSGCNVTRYDVDGACWDEWPTYENMNFRVTIVMVGAGEAFSGWGNYP
jgi:hypothetical protein